MVRRWLVAVSGLVLVLKACSEVEAMVESSQYGKACAVFFREG